MGGWLIGVGKFVGELEGDDGVGNTEGSDDGKNVGRAVSGVPGESVWVPAVGAKVATSPKPHSNPISRNSCGFQNPKSMVAPPKH